MKFRFFRGLVSVLFVLSFFYLQNVFAQTVTVKRFYSTSGEITAGKTAVVTRPRITVAAKNDAVEKPKTNFDRKSINVFDVERRVFDLVNRKRIEAGLSALAWSDDIARMARLHSENMAAFDFFSHTGNDGKLVNDRADAAGIKHWRMIGENIAYNRGYGDPIACAVEKWLLSPGHRDNMLKSDWKESGIGVAITEKGTFYFTQVFLLKK